MGVPINRPGISEEFLSAAGVVYSDYPEPGSLQIPYFNIQGAPTGFCRWRLAHTRPGGQKYHQEPNTEFQLYFNHLVLESDRVLHLTEGEFKTMALRESGFQAIGLPGLHCYTRKLGMPQLLAGIPEAVALVKPDVIRFIGDSDTFTNLEYFRSAQFLAKEFEPIRVQLVQLPLDGPKGVDDLRAQLNGQFSSWMETIAKDALSVAPGESFLLQARIQLEMIIPLLAKLPAADRERHYRRAVYMAALARTAQQPTFDLERFCEVAQKASGLTKAAFERAVEDVLAKLTPSQPTTEPEQTPRSFERTTEPWPEPVNGAVLLKRLRDTIKRFVVVSEDDLTVLALWIIQTYLPDCFNIAAIIHVKSPEKRCGKSTLIDVMELLVYRPLTAVTITPASLYRLIEKYHPTVLLDEADSFGKENDDLRAIVNAGYERGRYAPRTNNETGEIDLFDTFGCKLLASIGPLHETIEDRSLIIHMKRKPSSIEVEELCDVPRDVFIGLERQVQRFADDIRPLLKNFIIARPKLLLDRNWKKWRPLLSIASLAGDDGRELTRSLTTAFVFAKGGDEELSIRIEIINRLRDAFIEQYSKDVPIEDQFLSTTDVLQHLNSDDEAPWANWKTGDTTGLSAERLARELKHFGVKSVRRKKSGCQIKGYWLKDLLPTFESYKTTGPQKPGPEASFSQETPENGHQPCPASVSSSESTVDRGEGTTSEPSPFASKGSGVDTGTLTPVGASASTTYRRGAGLEPQKEVKEQKKIDLGDNGSCTVLSTPDHVSAYSAALSATTIALDIETWAPTDAKTERKFIRKGTVKKACTALDWQVAHIRLLSLYAPGDAQPVVIDLSLTPSTDMRRAVAELLTKLSTVELIGHNLSFDLTFLGNEFGFKPKNVWDTCAAVKLLENDDKAEIHARDGSHYDHDPRDYHASLGAALYYYANIDIDKGLGGGGESGFGEASLSDEQYVYSSNDVRHIPILVDRLRAEVASAGLDAVAQLEFDIIPWSAQAELTGVPTDAPAMDAAIAKRVEALKAAEALIETAMTSAGFDTAPFYQQKRKRDPLKFNANSTLLKEAFFVGRLDEEGLVIILPTTLKGHPSFTEDAFKEVKHPVARCYLEYDKLCSEILTLKQRRKHVWDTNAIHSTFNLLGANTGRITVSDPAMQNIPTDPESRGMYKAPPGMVFVQGDLSRIELRAQAQFSGDSAMLAALNRPKSDPFGDLYAITGSKIFDVPLEKVAGDDKHPAYKLGKRVNLSFCYGMQAQEFQNRTRDSAGKPYTLEEAIAFRQAYFDLYPGMAAWIEGAWDATRTGRVIEGRTKLGRRRLILPTVPGTRNTRSWREFQAQINYLVQGSCADGLKIAIARILARLPQGAVIILSVHDELLILCKEDDGESVAKIANTEMTEAYRIAFGGELLVRIEFNAKPIKSWAEK